MRLFFRPEVEKLLFVGSRLYSDKRALTFLLFFFQTATYDGRGFAREGLGSGLGQVGEVLLVVEHPGAGDPGDGRTRDPRREVGDDGAQGDDDEGEEDFLLQECKKKDARIIQEEANNKHVLKTFLNDF